MGRAKSVSELLATKIETFPFRDEWYDAFGEPERKGIWIVWKNGAVGRPQPVRDIQGGSAGCSQVEFRQIRTKRKEKSI